MLARLGKALVLLSRSRSLEKAPMITAVAFPLSQPRRWQCPSQKFLKIKDSSYIILHLSLYSFILHVKSAKRINSLIITGFYPHPGTAAAPIPPPRKSRIIPSAARARAVSCRLCKSRSMPEYKAAGCFPPVLTYPNFSSRTIFKIINLMFHFMNYMERFVYSRRFLFRCIQADIRQ